MIYSCAIFQTLFFYCITLCENRIETSKQLLRKNLTTHVTIVVTIHTQMDRKEQTFRYEMTHFK